MLSIVQADFGLPPTHCAGPARCGRPACCARQKCTRPLVRHHAFEPVAETTLACSSTSSYASLVNSNDMERKHCHSHTDTTLYPLWIWVHAMPMPRRSLPYNLHNPTQEPLCNLLLHTSHCLYSKMNSKLSS